MSRIDELEEIAKNLRNQVAMHAVEVSELREQLAEAEMVFAESVKRLRYNLSQVQEDIDEGTES